ncbi:MAG TPA: hypothetical protein VMV66_01040 [Candidatus Humimicrobiaceae bacterium]|nr:hypothetical protein [Candidatus Humimicrobiaceae bacterium]
MTLQEIKKFVKNQDWRSWSRGKMKVRAFIDHYQADIILVVGVILISLLSFAMGYIVARTYDRPSLELEMFETTENKEL